MHRGHGQLEVGPGQAGNDLPGERHVVGERGLTVRGPQQQGERELRGAGADVAPPEALRGVRGNGERLGRVEAPAGEVDFPGRAHALDDVGNWAERAKGDDADPAACDELDEDHDVCVGSNGSDESPHGHALAMDERLVAHLPSPGWPRGHGGYGISWRKRARERSHRIRRSIATARRQGRAGRTVACAPAGRRYSGAPLPVGEGDSQTMDHRGPPGAEPTGTLALFPSDGGRTRVLAARAIEAGDFDLYAFARHSYIRIFTYSLSMQMLHTVLERFAESRVESVLE